MLVIDGVKLMLLKEVEGIGELQDDASLRRYQPGDSCSVTVSGACSPGTFSGSALSQSFNSNATGSTNITCDNAITGANLTVALSCTC